MDKDKFKQIVKAQYKKEREITDYCRCGKPLMRRDVDYSVHFFGEPMCRMCSPYGTPPISERYNLNDPDQLDEARKISQAEGFEVGKNMYANRKKYETI